MPGLVPGPDFASEAAGFVGHPKVPIPKGPCNSIVQGGLSV